MRIRHYRGTHLRRRPVSRGPAVVGAAAAVWMVGPAAQAGVHVVRSGETLSGIADRFNVPMTKLVRANHLSNPNLVVVGQRIRIPGRAAGTKTHIVRSGETLSGIADRFHTSIARLQRMNKIRNVNLIPVGMKLRVPRGGSGGGAMYSPPSTSRTAVERSLYNQAVAHGVDVSLVKAVAWQESGWQQDVTSHKGAVGVMQVMPGTARYVNQVLGGGHLRIRVMDDNVHLGVMYLHHMLAITSSESKALAAYYSGPGNVGRRLKGYQRPYVRSVLAIRERFR